MSTDDAILTCSGKFFHSVYAASLKDRRPYAVRGRREGALIKFCDEERSDRLGVYRVMRSVRYEGASPLRHLYVSRLILNAILWRIDNQWRLLMISEMLSYFFLHVAVCHLHISCIRHHLRKLCLQSERCTW